MHLYSTCVLGYKMVAVLRTHSIMSGDIHISIKPIQSLYKHFWSNLCICAPCAVNWHLLSLHFTFSVILFWTEKVVVIFFYLQIIVRTCDVMHPSTFIYPVVHFKVHSVLPGFIRVTIFVFDIYLYLEFTLNPLLLRSRGKESIADSCNPPPYFTDTCQCDP